MRLSTSIWRPRPVARLTLIWLALSVSMSATTLAVEGDPGPAPVNVEEAPSRGTGNVSPEVAQKAAAIARQTMSPFCPGRTLSDCPSEYATAWRRDIREMVARGMSAHEIQRELESRVGANLSGSPNRSAGYGVSLGLALGAGLVLFFVLTRLRHNSLAARSARNTRATDLRAQADPARGVNQGDETSKDQKTTVAPSIDDRRLEEELRLADGDNE